MRAYLIWAGVALGLFALAMIGRRDWLRLTRPSRRVIARVTGHRVVRDGDGTGYAAIYSFEDDDGHHEAIDQVVSTSCQPDEGTMIDLTYPAGHPHLARPPRPLMWLGVYAMLIWMTGMMAAVGLGLVE